MSKFKKRNLTRKTHQGYILIRTAPGVWELKHRVVMEQKIKRKLRSKEIVHHKDGNKENNDITNLFLGTQRSHVKEHWREGLYDQKPKFARCHPNKKHYAKGLCQLCYNRLKQRLYSKRKKIISS